MLIIFFLCVIIADIVCPLGMPGASCKLKAVSISPCDDPADTEYQLEADLKEINGNMGLYVTMTLPVDVTEEFTVLVELEKFKDGQWRLQHTIDGNLWERVQKFCKKMYDKIALKAQPNLALSFPIEAGSYALEHLELERDDIESPMVIYGLIRATLRIFNEDEDQVVCRVFEMEAQ